MNSSLYKRGLLACVVGMTAGSLLWMPGNSQGQVTFNFDSEEPFSSSIIGGDKAYFTATTEEARSATQSVKFYDIEAKPYESFTYDVPFDNMTSGVISVWFYDSKTTNTQHDPKAGGSIILEDKNNPQDFVALEVLSLMYPMPGFNPTYYGTEGINDRAGASRFDSTLPKRAIGFHNVQFHVSATDTKLYVDGVLATKVAGPGSASKLRLRFMADSPSNGGAANWIASPHADGKSWWIGEEWIYFDDITFTQELPTAEVLTQDFEIISGAATYDTVSIPATGGTPAVLGYDNPYMKGFVNQWGINTNAAAIHSGSQSAYFANDMPEPFKALTFDLNGVQAGTTATIYFYDSLGQDNAFDKTNSILIENANDPAEFMGLEINNWPYPHTATDKTYFVVNGTPGATSNDPATGGFFSKGLFARSIGWHKVEIGFYATYTSLYVDDVEARFLDSYNQDSGPARGPGVDKSLRIRLMADSATQGGGSNWTNADEVNALYVIGSEPYVYYDDITLPIAPPASVGGWQLY